MSRPPKEIPIGKRIGKLMIISEGERYISSSGKSLRTAICICDCGKTKTFLLDNLMIKKPSKSCGCINIERSRIENRKHGLKDHTLYRKWFGMKTRCYNPKYENYNHYGGRGIIVCNEWVNDFKAFYDWAIENGWREGLEIDRISNDGNYEPTNCRFVTTLINNRNRSISKLTTTDIIDIRNIKLLIPEVTYSEIAEGFHIHASTVGQILRNEIWKGV